MWKFSYILFFVILISLIQCKDSSSVLPPASDSTGQPPKKNLTLSINLNEVHQTIHSFGASDGWTTKFIGTWTDVDKKNKIADLLFSMDTLKNGSPEGIGLSLWRFNIGAGSYEQGDSSDIATDWRREECFLNVDGTYDWSKEAGHQWFLQAAKKRGVKYTLGFALSPPVYMTKNGKAFNGTTNTSMNIRPGKMGDYADFLAKVANHFHFDYISPVNEPQWSWGESNSASQEGTQATNEEIASLVKLLSANLSGSSTKVVVGEAGEWDFLYGKNSDSRGDQIAQFFSSSSSNYIGNLPNVEHAISSHSYFTTCPENTLVSIRQQVADRIKQVDPTLQTWMTEFGVLGNICGQLNGYPRNTSIDYGLYVAKVLYADLTIANVTSWQWWLAVNPYDYSDGLVYINDPSGKIDIDNCKQDGIVLESKQLWALGNYSRFIRPGMERIDVSISGYIDPLSAAPSLMVSAYKDEKDKELVIVLVNISSEVKTLELDNNNSFNIKNNLFNTYTTSAVDNLKRSYAKPDSIVVQPKSIVTLTGKYQ
ncbi:MAG: hypothetical protein IRZ03_10985 [Acidobacterium ailaaui]|nr:hypothetical protein [Pseudacidobacterium ailaaui]